MNFKSGSWYSYNNEKIGQGRENAINFLRTNVDITQDLDTKLRAIMFPQEEEESK